jgi:carbonic anhydrase
MSPCQCCLPNGDHAVRFRRRGILTAAALACLGLPGPARAAGPAADQRMTPDQAIAALMDGNARYRAGTALPTASTPAHRAALAAGQAPFAAILGCADSRAAPELLFHAGRGALFVVRNAGNIADTGAVGSLEYAVAHLGVSVIMVLGHERCGAASAAVSTVQATSPDPAMPAQLGDMLLPMLPAALAGIRGGNDVVDGAVRANVRRSAARLTEVSPLIAGAQSSGRIRIVGAYYDLDDEKVSLLG